MRAFIFVLLLISFSYSAQIVLDKNVEKNLDLKTFKVNASGNFQSKKYPAVVNEDPTLSYSVYSPVEGVIENIFVKQGDKVKKGQILAYVYSPKIVSINADIQMAKVKLNTAKQLLEREEMLYKEEIIPYARFFSAKIEYEKALGEYNALLKILNSYGEIKGNNIVLRSKVNGFVAESKVVKGDSVDLTKELFKIHSHERLWIIAYLPFEDTKNIKIGSKAKVLSDGKEIYGKVDLINHEIDPKTKRNEVRIVVNNVGDLLKPNMFVDVEFQFPAVKGFIVPSTAIFQEKGKYYLFLKKDNKYILQEVKIDSLDKDKAIVVEGLKEGDEVVYKNVIFLRTKLFGGAGE